ncbi:MULTISPECIES: metal-sulfur cluster assembly factor [unclassified Methanopyrus]|uniref:metal-sulfur cluster assembly factor n=1 Tax=unclassified Methanopyrus TaxID=2684913 RepID=UPI000B4B203C|nr:MULTISPECIES: metal-sulfur cluster assembly factor [unclassified Methanopyrus]
MPSEEEVLKELKSVKDPHTGLDIVSMKLIEEVNADDENIEVIIRPTNPFCPSALMIVEQVKAALQSAFEGVNVDVKLVGHVLTEEEE